MPKETDRLATYRGKRHPERTPEPMGEAEAAGASQRRYVVQRHRATRLHYDFRLEIDGALVSWAVPKGPTLDPAARRAAIHVEDHPLEYYDFEGIIPAGEYGGGDVIVWDSGTWEPSTMDDPGSAVNAGELHFDLRGEKLRGSVHPGANGIRVGWIRIGRIGIGRSWIGRRQGTVAADAQTRRVRRRGLGSGGVPAIRPLWTDK